jgi:hypothetical protein
VNAPELPRTFSLLGGLKGSIVLAVPPIALLGFSLARSGRERIFGGNALLFGLAIVAMGFLLYSCATRGKRRLRKTPAIPVPGEVLGETSEPGQF